MTGRKLAWKKGGLILEDQVFEHLQSFMSYVGWFVRILGLGEGQVLKGRKIFGSEMRSSLRRAGLGRGYGILSDKWGISEEVGFLGKGAGFYEVWEVLLVNMRSCVMEVFWGVEWEVFKLIVVILE